MKKLLYNFYLIPANILFTMLYNCYVIYVFNYLFDWFLYIFYRQNKTISSYIKSDLETIDVQEERKEFQNIISMKE